MLTIVIMTSDRKIQFPHCMSQIKNVIKQATKPSLPTKTAMVSDGNTHTNVYALYRSNITGNERRYVVYHKMFSAR